MSGYHHWVRGNESQARAKWKFGVSHGDKHGMELWSTLCQQQLLRTDSHHHMNIEAYQTVENRFRDLGYPLLEQAVKDEIASFEQNGKEWNTLQKEVVALDATHRKRMLMMSDSKRLSSRLSHPNLNINLLGRSSGGDLLHGKNHRQSMSSGSNGHTPRGSRRRNSVLRDADFSNHPVNSRKSVVRPDSK